MASARAVGLLAGPALAAPSSDPATDRPCDYDVVILGASAGGVTACMNVLQRLPRDFPLPIVLMLHLPSESTLPTYYLRLPFDVEWARSGTELRRRRLLICPSGSIVELLPNGAPAP